LEKPVAIVGLGALGSVFAALLARAGTPVIGVCRGQEHREAVEAGGLLLREGEQESRLRFPVVPELPGGESLALVIVLVKSFDTETAAKSLAGRVDSHTPVLTLQNGLGNAEALAAHLSPDQILAGTTTFGALREAPGIVQITGRGECEIGAWRPAGERYLPQVKELFMRAGVECRLTAQTAATLWKKLAINAAINPLTALLHVRNGALLELEELNPIVGMVVEEVMGLHTVDPISGDFSLGCSGDWIDRGQKVHPVKSIAIAGNLFELFRRVIGVGEDLRFFGAVGAPSLLINELLISGN